jgi:myo-inositol-1(or 4)-monophosphatase
MALRHRINAGRVAVESQVAFFRAQLGRVASEWKEDATRVTFADFAISEKIFAALRRDFPQDDFCSEESSPADEVLELEADFAWILDPIDGTNNYAMGMPTCAISLAILEAGMPVYGIIYDHARDCLIEGGPGFGVLDARRRASLKDEPLGRASAIGGHFPVPPAQEELYWPIFSRYRVRAIGSGALNLAYTATGYFDGSIDHSVKMWDIAAAAALIRAQGTSLRFLAGANTFPLTHFHVNSVASPYYAGSPAFLEMMAGLNFPLAEAD